MADLNLFGGGKGGVGKSMVCRATCQYLLDRSISFNLYESDRLNRLHENLRQNVQLQSRHLLRR